MHIVIDIHSTWWFLLHKISKGYKPTDSDCIWQYLYNVLRFRMRIMPHAVPCEWAQKGLRLNRTRKCTSGLCRLSMMCFFLLHFIWFSSCLLGFFFCTLTSLLSLSQCRQLSAVFSIQLRKTCTLWRISRAVLRVLHYQEAPSFPVLDLHRQCTWCMSFWACTWVRTVSTNWHSWAWQTRTYAHTLRK